MEYSALSAYSLSTSWSRTGPELATESRPRGGPSWGPAERVVSRKRNGFNGLRLRRWRTPFRPLTEEIETVLKAGYLRGADLWHVANALYAFPGAAEVGFFTLDERQRAVAAELGFQV